MQFRTSPKAASILVGIALLLAGDRVASAQVLPVDPGDSVRVSAPPYTVGAVPGRAIEVTDDSLLIRFNARTSPIWIPNASVQRVELWGGARKRRDAL